MKTTSYFILSTVLFLVVVMPPYRACAQQKQSYTPADDYDMNVAKINLLALPFRNFSLQYERLVSRKISVAVGIRMIPKGAFPLLNAFESYIDDEETFSELQNLSVSNQAITIEPRFYFGRHDGPRGFYIAPYARYSAYGLGFDQFEYTMEMEQGDGSYTEETHYMALDGRVNGFTGGVLFGCQWRIAQWVYLDWWILGPAYGTAKGKLSGAAPLTPEAQSALRGELEQLEIPMVKTEAHVDANGARLAMKGPWAGIRSGLAVGVKSNRLGLGVMFFFRTNKQRPILKYALLLWFCLMDGPSVAQYQVEEPQQQRIMGLESIRTLPEGRQKLVETLRFTRLPHNINPESEALLDQGIAYAKTTDNQSLLPDLLINKALIAIYKKANDEALVLLDEASAITQAFSLEQQLAPLNAMAIGYRRANQLDKALAAHERHNGITQGKTDHSMVMHRITNLQNQGSLYHFQRQMDKVRQCNREVKRLIKLIDDPRLVFNVTFNLAGMLINIDEVVEASVLLNELMPAIERNTDGRAPRFYEMVAENAQRKGDIPRSAEFYAKVYQTGTANPQQKLRSATQLVRCYIEMGQADSVEKYIRVCREMRSNPMATYGDADQWLVDAQYAAFKSDYRAAKAIYLKMLQMTSNERLSYPIPVFQAQMELATLYHQNDRPDSARYYLRESGVHIKDVNIPRFLKIRYYAAAETINEGTGLTANKDSVIAALEHQLALKDSLFSQSATSAYAEMESKYNLHEKEHQLHRARQQQEIQALELKRQQQRVLISILGSTVIIILLAFIAFTLIRQRRQAKERHESQLQQLAQQHHIATAHALREAEEDERRKIARKLHDEVGAQLSIVRLNVDQLEADTLTATSDASNKLQVAQRLLSDMSETVRAISHSLMPVALEKYGLKSAILDLVDAVNASGKIKVEEVIEGLDNTDGWGDEFRFGLYRIVQEILNNIIKHAQASHVLVQIVELGYSVTIYVEDNGRGLDNKEVPLGIGLKLLKSNIEYFNGAIEINGRENHGTFVLIELPLESGRPA